MQMLLRQKRPNEHPDQGAAKYHANTRNEINRSFML